MRGEWLGPALIGSAALLWATDTPFRYALLRWMSPTGIVFLEHVIGALAALGWVRITRQKSSLRMGARDLLLALLVGAGGSALASVLFTASFSHLNASVAILLQKLQPVFVILLARVFLGEKPEPGFYGWATLALFAALALSLGAVNPLWHRMLHQTWHEVLHLNLGSRGVGYAIGAAALWALATVAGRTLVRRHPPAVVTAWRYLFGLVMLAGMLWATGHGPFRVEAGGAAGLRHVALPLLYTSLVSGLLSMLAYYRGLSLTTASVATFVELLYPVSAVLLNFWLLHQPLDPVQWVAGAVLLFAVSQIA